MNNPCRGLTLRLGQSQLDAMFGRLNEGPIIDDADFFPLVEAVLMAFETAGIGVLVIEELWEYADSRYDRYCQQADPSLTTAENIRLMRNDSPGPRRIRRRTG